MSSSGLVGCGRLMPGPAVGLAGENAGQRPVHGPASLRAERLVDGRADQGMVKRQVAAVRADEAGGRGRPQVLGRYRQAGEGPGGVERLGQQYVLVAEHQQHHRRRPPTLPSPIAPISPSTAWMELSTSAPLLV